MHICMLYLKYCTVGDHFGFQVGFLKQYFVWVCLYWFGVFVLVFVDGWGVMD